MHPRFLRKLNGYEQRLYNLGYRDGEKSNQKPFKYIPDKEPVDDINIFSKIKFKVSKYYKISEKELFGPQRDSYLVFPRSMAINLMRELTYLRFSQIGFLINRDHTTLVYHVSLRINKKGYWKIPNNHAVYNQLKTELINESQQ